MKRVICAILFFACFVAGCQFKTLKKQVKRIDNSYYLRGQLTPGTETSGTVWAFVLEKPESGLIRIMDIEKVPSGGAFVFMLPPGDHYQVGVMEDRNGNELHDEGERIWMYGNPSPVPFTNGKSELLAVDLDRPTIVDVNDQRMVRELRTGRKLLALKSGGSIPIVEGEVAELADPRFSEKMGQTGLWEPDTFMHEVGFGVFFREDYDPQKIPVLFVNGTGGSPRHLRILQDTLDPERYQVWFFHYPTGMRLDLCGATLNHIIEDLHHRYQFPKMHVVAHSMGGLVARSFLVHNKETVSKPYIQRFVTLSTPWNGHEAASLGVKHAPAVIPAWIDMQSNSDFVNDLLGQTLEENVEFYLLYSYQGNNAAYLPSSNDGTVSMASQLDVRVQEQAIFQRGFDLNHMGIIQEKEVTDLFAQILDGMVP